MICRECDAELRSTDELCPRCGAEIGPAGTPFNTRITGRQTTRRPSFGEHKSQLRDDLFARYKRMLVNQGFSAEDVERTGWYIEIEDTQFELEVGERKVFGRHSDCDIHVSDEYVSRRHLEFVAGPTQMTMLVLRPDNPPTIADTAISGAEVIRPEDCPLRVKAGNTFLEVHCRPGTLLTALIEQHQD